MFNPIAHAYFAVMLPNKRSLNLRTEKINIVTELEKIGSIKKYFVLIAIFLNHVLWRKRNSGSSHPCVLSL